MENNQQAVEAAENKTYSLRQPFVFEGETISKLEVDFQKLTGADMMLAERRFLADSGGNGGGFVKEMNKTFQSYVVASAAGVPVELIAAMPARDFTALTLKAQDFLLF